MSSGFIIHPDLGNVKIVTHPTSRKLSARWNLEFLKVVVPERTRRKDIEAFLNQFTPQLLATRPQTKAVEDLIMEDWKLTVSEQSAHPDKILLKYSLSNCSISFGTSFSTDPERRKVIYNKAAATIARNIASTLLFPRARHIADDLGCKPESWKISHGTKVLGHCNSRKEIALSYMNVFLPIRLRDYIVCHELAHLTEMNHSARFHHLCDRYTGGKEKELEKELKNFKWPVKR